jgi:hypothetical protein
MSFTEVNLFGVYVAPISVMMVAAWLVLLALRRGAGAARRLRNGRPKANLRRRHRFLLG